MTEFEVDRLVHQALAVTSVDEAAYERARVRSHAVIRELAAAHAAAEPAPRQLTAIGAPRRRRLVLLVAIMVLLLAAAVVAAPDVARRILDSVLPAADRMEAFHRPSQHDAIPPSARRKLAALVWIANGGSPDDADSSAAPVDDVRALLDMEQHGSRVGIWGSRTKHHRACYILVAGPAGEAFPDLGGLGTCIEFRPGWPISDSYGTVTPGRWGVVGGIADDVVDVRMIMPDGTASPALLGRNVFAWVEDADHELPIAIEAELVDGTVIRRDDDLEADRSGTRTGTTPPAGPYVVRHGRPVD